MENETVSIVMPCYNSEGTVAQAIRGVISQTYRPIELILVNDGSTDGSSAVIESMAESIRDAGIAFQYHIQENQGLGGAIEAGLQYVTGGYLAWIDSDDELLPESVAIRVKFLQEHPDFGSVSSNAVEFISRNGKDQLGNLVGTKVKVHSEENQFPLMLRSQTLFCPGCHLVRTEVFRQSHGGMHIYPARHGQNFQMLLPVYYVSKHGFVNIPLYKYRVTDSSMSATTCQLEPRKFFKRQAEYKNIVRYTLKQIPGMPDKDRRHYYHGFRQFIMEQNLDRSISGQHSLYALKWIVLLRLHGFFFR